MAGLLNNSLITADSVKATYILLKKLPPFNTWKLPSDKQIKFLVKDNFACMGELQVKPYKITIGSNHHEHFVTLVTTIAHEMAHLKLYIDGVKSFHRHTQEFRKLTSQIGSIFGFDRKTL
jgi:hypothetical protein